MTIMSMLTATNDEIAGVVHLGTHPRPTKEQTMVFNIHGFAELTATKHETPLIFCHGYHWNLEIHPNGDIVESRGHVSLYLICRDAREGQVDSVTAKYTIRAINHPSSIREIPSRSYTKQTFGGWGERKCWSREKAISYCDANGSLVIEVSLQVHPYYEQGRAVSCWKPKKSMSTKLARLYESKSGADVTFVIGNNNRPCKVHRLVLELTSPTLVGMLLNDDPTNHHQVDVPIKDTNPDLFETLIRFLYTEDLPESFRDEDHAIELLKLADKFGCWDLKMLLEARIVETPKLFCAQNAAELFVLADAKNCALLLENSLELVVENISSVREAEGWKDIKESPELMETIIDALSRRIQTPDAALEDPSVSTLRKQAFERGLDADGSRQDLLMRLKTFHAAKGEHSSDAEDQSTIE